jgi:hypothetical protein
MSGSVSGSQFNFLPRAVPKIADGDSGVEMKTGQMYQHWKGESSVAPHASGAYTTFDKQTAFRNQDPEKPVSHSSTTVGSWLFKNA